jgi:Spy/CpxP family protein refolding chaperone
MKWAVVLLVPAVFGATARPAEPAVPEGATVKLLLLRQKSVQKELELTPETTRKIMAFTNAESEAVGKAIEQGETARREAFVRLAKRNRKFLADTLTPQQTKRLNQITMQFTALRQLTRPEMARALNLSDEQVQKLKDLQRKARTALVDLLETKEREAETTSSRSCARRRARKSWPS